MIADFGDVRVRVVEYDPGGGDEDWNNDGRILLCVCGVARVELAGGRMVVLGPGSSCQLRANEQPHRTYTHTGATLLSVE